MTHASIRIVQDGNTMGTTDDYENLEINLEYQLSDPGEGDDCFLTIKTNGWSLNEPDDLGPILADFRAAIGQFSRGRVNPKSQQLLLDF